MRISRPEEFRMWLGNMGSLEAGGLVQKILGY